MNSNGFDSFLNKAEITELLNRYFAALDQAEMTGRGWRITHLSNDVIWRKGTGFKQILQTQYHQHQKPSHEEM